jgi:ABC-type transport system substrate-binding protein
MPSTAKRCARPLRPKFYTAALQMYPEPFKGVCDSYNCTYDLDKAEDLLAEAGIRTGSKSTFCPAVHDKDAMIA